MRPTGNLTKTFTNSINVVSGYFLKNGMNMIKFFKRLSRYDVMLRCVRKMTESESMQQNAKIGRITDTAFMRSLKEIPTLSTNEVVISTFSVPRTFNCQDPFREYWVTVPEFGA